MVGKSESLDTIVNECRCTEITLVSSSWLLFRAWLHIQTTLRCVLFSSQHRDTVPHVLSRSLITQWKHSHSSIEDCVTVCDRHMQIPETYSTANNISFSFFIVRCLCNWYCLLVYKRTAMVSIEIWQEKHL